jgi:hypothetical protein
MAERHSCLGDVPRLTGNFMVAAPMTGDDSQGAVCRRLRPAARNRNHASQDHTGDDDPSPAAGRMVIPEHYDRFELIDESTLARMLS